MNEYGIQLIAELNDCDPQRLDDADYLQDMLSSGIEDSGLRLVRMISQTFEPVGVTVMVMISESHIALHTYPETRHACLDVFHCSGERTPMRRLLECVQQALHATSTSFVEVRRGTEAEILPPELGADR